MIATEWQPSKGGVSSFNMELCLALQRTGHEVHCVVPRASEPEFADASSNHVQLHSAAAHGVVDGAPFDLGVVPDVVVGHDRWTGPEAARWRQRFPEMRLALLLHVHPGQIDGLKTDDSLAARAARIAETRHRIAHAHAAFGVGGQLADWWQADVPGFDVHPFVPGLPTALPATPRVAPPHPRVLLLGRGEDAELKGVQLTARAMREVVDAGFREAELVVRGVAVGTEVAFEQDVRVHYPRPRRFTSRPFDARRGTIARDLATASLVLQPSLEEGFGLVTLEAISMETPVLVGSHSGVARLLERVDAANAVSFVVQAGDEEAWREAIARVLSDIPEARNAVRTLRAAVAAAHSWDAAVANLVATTIAAPRPLTQAARPPAVEQCLTASAALGEYPRKTDGRWVSRREEQTVASWLTTALPEHENGVLLLVGPPGTGKSALLASLVQQAQSINLPVLGIKADLLPADIGSPEALRAHLGLDRPIAEMLEEMAAVYGSALLVIDQLDALCEVVDSRTSRLNALIQLMRQASQLEDVRIVASVRPFELRHEARLRALQSCARDVSLGLLAVDDLRKVIPEVLVPDLLEPGLLTPHALDLIVHLSRHEGDRFYFPSSLGELRERFWRAGVADDTEREQAALAVANAIGESGALWVHPPSGIGERALQDLVQTGILRRSADDILIGFRHQTIFDFARARRLIRDDRLADFIAEHQQSFEIRPLVRSALLHLRSANRDSYHKLAERLSCVDALHLRLLVIDTVLEADSPTRREERLFIGAVKDPKTRRRALNGLGSRDGWLLSLTGSISGWMSDYREHSLLLASGFLRVSPQPALATMEAAWLGTEDGCARIVRVLSWAAHLPPDADPLIEKLIPHLVRKSHFELGPIGQAVARDDVRRAVRLHVSCIEEGGRTLLAGEAVSRDSRMFDELLELEADPDFALDLLEPVAMEFFSHADRPLSAYDFEERLEQTYEQLLQRSAKAAPEKVIARAWRLGRGTDLLRVYLRVIGQIEGHVSDRVSWVSGDPARLSVDPESVYFLETVSGQLAHADVRALDAAIDEAVRYAPLGPNEPVEWRRDREKENRRYRLCLRARLPQPMRDQARISFDEAEAYQLPGPAFEPDRGPRAGFVVSPLSKEQLSRASDAAVLNALEKQRDRFEFDENGLPLGGPDEIVSELGKLAEENPERVVTLIEQMRDKGEVVRARRLLVSAAQHHPDPTLVEQLAISLMGDCGEALELDHECPWALTTLTSRGALAAASIDAILARLEGASPNTPKAANAGWKAPKGDSSDEESRRHLALFDYRGGPVVPGGGYRWLRALTHHYFRLNDPEPDTWARAVRGALRADPDPDKFAFALADWARQWGWLAGPHAVDLLNEIAASAFAPSSARALTRVYACHRKELDPAIVRGWITRLEATQECTAAAELAVLIASDEPPLGWADEVLCMWRASDRAADFSTGVLGAVGRLLRESDRRAKASMIAADWIAVARVQDLELLFASTVDLDTWKADRACVAILEALLPRIPEMESDGLRHVVFLLERFLHVEPDLVLSMAEQILDRALADDDGAAWVVISECLALSISLRLALPAEADRTHSLFEKALAADAPAAMEALDAVDGRSGAGPIRPRYRGPRRTVGRGRRRLRPYF